MGLGLVDSQPGRSAVGWLASARNAPRLAGCARPTSEAHPTSLLSPRQPFARLGMPRRWRVRKRWSLPRRRARSSMRGVRAPRWTGMPRWQRWRRSFETPGRADGRRSHAEVGLRTFCDGTRVILNTQRPTQRPTQLLCLAGRSRAWHAHLGGHGMDALTSLRVLQHLSCAPRIGFRRPETRSCVARIGLRDA